MSNVVIHAASWLDGRGYGNDLAGFRQWPSAMRESTGCGSLDEAHWSVLFPSDPGRFGRMDLMSRLGLMAAELLEAGIGELPEETRQHIAVCVETTAGSLSTDLKFLQTPRASIFSYTLPSTVIGEICIRYRVRGPVLCLVTGEQDHPALAEATRLLEDNEAHACICLRCDVLDADAVRKLGQPSLWTSPKWEAAALWLGRKTGATREYPLTAATVRENSAKLCQAEA